MQFTDVVVEAYELPQDPQESRSRTQSIAVRVLSSPAGEMSAAEAVPVVIDRRQLRQNIEQLEHRSLDQIGLIDLGRNLAQFLLPPRNTGRAVGVRELFLANLSQVGQDGGVRLRLRLSPTLAGLPWEYLYIDELAAGGGMAGFLALHPQIAIVRHETLPSPTVYYAQARLNEALDQFQIALAILRDVHDRREQAVTVWNIGVIYAQLGQPQDAEAPFVEALELYEAMGMAEAAKVRVWLERVRGAR